MFLLLVLAVFLLQTLAVFLLQALAVFLPAVPLVPGQSVPVPGLLCLVLGILKVQVQR